MFEALGVIFCVVILLWATAGVTFMLIWSSALNTLKMSETAAFILVYSILGYGWYFILSKLDFSIRIIS